MELTIKQERFAKALNTVSRMAASTRVNLPILSNILMVAEKNTLTLIATDMEIAIEEKIAAKVEKTGRITVPARLLAEFVSNLPKSDISLKTEGLKLEIKAEKYHSSLNGILADDFPELPKINKDKVVEIITKADLFKEVMSKVIIASSNDTTRPALTGVYFNSFEGDLYACATDGYRLAEYKFIKKIGADLRVIVPANTIQEVLRLISDDTEEITMWFDESQVRFKLDDSEITSKVIDMSYPDYRRLIPKKSDLNIRVDKEELIRMVKVAGLFSQGRGASIKIETSKAEQKMLVSAIASELGDNNSSLDTEVSEDKKVSLSSRYLLDALNQIQERQVQIGISGKLSPVVIQNVKSKDYIHIVMPVKS